MRKGAHSVPRSARREGPPQGPSGGSGRSPVLDETGENAHESRIVMWCDRSEVEKESAVVDSPDDWRSCRPELGLEHDGREAFDGDIKKGARDGRSRSGSATNRGGAVCDDHVDR